MEPALLTLPADASSEIGRRPVFDWTDVSGADRYVLQVSRNPNFTGVLALNVKVDASASTYVPTKDLPLGLLYWRIQVLGDNGPSLWSDVYEVTLN